MKKASIIIGVLGIVVIILALLTACSSSSTTSPTKSSPPASTPTSAAGTTTAVSTTPAASQPAQTSGANLSSILGQAAGIASMKYDMVTTAPDNTAVNATVWMKKKKMRMETSQMGKNVVMLIDINAQSMLLYMPDDNTAMKMDFGQVPEAAVQDSSSILNYSPTVVGSETLDGKLCTIIQYNAEGVTTKSWIWQAKGLPVRAQTTSPQGTTTIDFKNYDFSDIPDSKFELPAGVQVTDFNIPTGIPTNLPGNLPTNFPTNLPTGLPTNIP
jgi:hypothetical protein